MPFARGSRYDQGMRQLGWLVIAGCAAPAAGTTSQPITNGSADPADGAVVALVDSTGRAGCTATVIGPHTAITRSALRLRVRRPDAARILRRLGCRRRHVRCGVRRPDRSDVRQRTLAHDLALVTLRDPAPAAPRTLEPGPLDSLRSVGTLILAVGYGTTGTSADDGGTRHAGSAQNPDVAATELTAVPMPSQPCRGDSGGPAILPRRTIAAVAQPRRHRVCRSPAIHARIDIAARASSNSVHRRDRAGHSVHVGMRAPLRRPVRRGAVPGHRRLSRARVLLGGVHARRRLPAGMTCTDQQCRYPEPSPGALGSTCARNADCTSSVCLDSVCTRSCAGSAVCPAGYTCGGKAEGDCFATPGGCGCAGGGTDVPAWIIALVLLGEHDEWSLRMTSR